METRDTEHEDEGQPRGGISRRALLKAGGAATVAGAALGGTLMGRDAAAGDGGVPPGSGFGELHGLGAERESYWSEDGKYFVQKNVDMSRIEQNIIRARIEGEWHEYVVRDVDETFFAFNMNMRLRTLDIMMTAAYEMYNDAHNAAVGTYGSNRGDSRFRVNVAFKGIGWVPKPDKLDARIAGLDAHYKQTMPTKIDFLRAGYNDTAQWDRRILGSLELYTERTFETHTFLNQMVNPVSTLCTLAEQSYEFRTIARLMHPADPGLTDYEKKIVKSINFAHDFFHGGPDPNKLIVHNIGVVYWVIEEFDNSPWGATKTAGGHRRVPPP